MVQQKPTHRVSCHTAGVGKSSLIPLRWHSKVLQEEVTENWLEMYTDIKKCFQFCTIRSSLVSLLPKTTILVMKDFNTKRVQYRTLILYK